jgi:uncharacterized membrane protein YhaH (DUF805 family)
VLEAVAAATTARQTVNGQRSPGFVKAIWDGLARSFEFKGRTSVSGYWWFWLVATIGSGLVGGRAYLTVMAPLMSAGIRRMHDVNRSGWFLLVPFYNVYLLVQQGDTAANQYGPAPQ